ncbi:hypothetical protein WJX77_009748 [Trebouxia sp. C0004]
MDEVFINQEADPVKGAIPHGTGPASTPIDSSLTPAG